MSKFLRSVLVCVMSWMALQTFAQQLPDSGFEDWSGAAFDGNIQPASWNATSCELGRSCVVAPRF